MHRSGHPRARAALAALATCAASVAWPVAAQAQSGNSGADNAAGAFGALLGMFGLGLWSLWMCFIVALWVLMLVGFVLWVFMLIDVIQRPDDQFPEGQTKVLWLVLVLLAGIIGGAVYYFVVYKKVGKARPSAPAAVTPAEPAAPPDND